MPSGGYGVGDEKDREAIAYILAELIGDEWEGMLPDVLTVYVAARLQGAEPGQAARAGFEEWDL